MSEVLSPQGGGGFTAKDSGVTVSGGPFTAIDFTGDVSATDGGGGTLSVNVTLPAVAVDASDLGSGFDGALHFDGNPVTLGIDNATLTASSSTYTLTRNIWCSSITVDANIVILTKGFQIYCTGTATINGTLRCNGGNGVDAINGGGFSGSGGTAAITVAATYDATAAGAAGSNGGAGSTAASGPGPNRWLIGTAGASTTDGGTGGRWQGGGGGHGGGVYATAHGGGTTAPSVVLVNSTGYHTLAMAMRGQDLANLKFSTGTGGGGGGGANNAGGGGAAGGVVFLAARAITGSGAIEAKGGNGGKPMPNTANDGGGGGGGCGGVVVTLTASSYPLSVSVSVAGGTGGSVNGGDGQAGGNGGAGLHFQYGLST